jgi:hypothetical protein
MAEDYKRKLVNYFKKNLKKGYTEESLKWALINQGYSKIIIETTLKTATKELAQEAPLVKDKPLIRHQAFDQDDNPVQVKKKPWWKRIFGL